MAEPAIEIASVIQSASIQKHPSPEHDINPSTAASAKIPADVVSPDVSPTRSPSHSLSSASSADTIPSDIIRPRPRSRQHMPLPDLRFEQTYLASIKNADSSWRVAYITIRDQVLLPLAQGVGYHLLIFGWRHWNRGSKFAGKSLGSRIRRWWWEVNNWKLPESKEKVTKFAQKAEDFYVDKFGSSQGD